MRVARGASRPSVVLAAVLARAGPRLDRAAVLRFLAVVAVRVPAALLALVGRPALAALVALPALLAVAVLRARTTAAVFFRAALFLAVFRPRVFARVDPFLLVAAALRLAIAVVLSATGLP